MTMLCTPGNGSAPMQEDRFAQLKRLEIPGRIVVEQKRDQFPVALLTTPQGAIVEVHAFGGHVNSYIPAGGQEVLHKGDMALHVSGKPIRGGIPIIFLQFMDGRPLSGEGEKGPYPSHGPARISYWTPVGSFCSENETGITMRFENERASLEIDYTVSDHRGLFMRATIDAIGNPCVTPLVFHNYFRVHAARETSVRGLRGSECVDRGNGDAQTNIDVDEIFVATPQNAIYFNAQNQLSIRDPGASRTIHLEKKDLPDAVVWNCGPDHGFVDMTPDGWRQYVCVEAGAIYQHMKRVTPGSPVVVEQRIWVEGA